MARGATTMKMMSSTSTTSTRGVTLISECRPEPWAPPLSCMTSVLPRLGALGDQPHVLEAGVLDRDHGVPPVPEAIGGDLLVVDPERPPRVDRDQEPVPCVSLLGRCAGLGEVDLRSRL